MGSSESELKIIKLELDHAGLRLDQALTMVFDDYSRSQLQKWIKAGLVKVNGSSCEAKYKVIGNEEIQLTIPEIVETEFKPEKIPLNIIFEDDDVIVINKPAGLVVHPAAGNWSGTLQNGLLYYDSTLANVPRAGIIHRLDKDTSGIMLIAKTLLAHKHLVEELQERKIKRSYVAIVQGIFVAGGTVDAAIGRHRYDRLKMAVVKEGKHAITHYRVLEKFQSHTYLSVQLETGRTHQIRVHMAYIDHPIAGDKTYGGRPKFPSGAIPELMTILQSFSRQALHAREISFTHPVHQKQLTFQADVPQDILQLLDLLRKNN